MALPAAVKCAKRLRRIDILKMAYAPIAMAAPNTTAIIPTEFNRLIIPAVFYHLLFKTLSAILQLK